MGRLAPARPRWPQVATRRTDGPRKEPLAIEQILGWADEYHRRTGSWPTMKLARVARAGETWQAINAALREGLRGLPGGSSLARLLAAASGRAEQQGSAAASRRRDPAVGRRTPPADAEVAHYAVRPRDGNSPRDMAGDRLCLAERTSRPSQRQLSLLPAGRASARREIGQLIGGFPPGNERFSLLTLHACDYGA